MVYPMASGVAGSALIVFHALSLLLMPIESKTGKNLGEEAKEYWERCLFFWESFFCWQFW